MFRSFALRLFISMVLGFLIAVLVNESTFIFFKSEAGRAPERIELIIPDGTAAKVALGKSDSTLPDKMVFVQGDTLVVINKDSVDHHLGALFIPSNTSASLILNQAASLSYACSFEPTQYFGLDVREPVTLDTRIYGLIISGLPLGFIFFLYSILVWPIKSKVIEAE